MAILTMAAVLMEAFSQRFKNAIRSEVYHSSRSPVSARPTLSSGTDQGLASASSAYYPRRTRDSVSHENGRPNTRIRIRENTFDAPVESNSTEPQASNPRSVSIPVDHLKSLITMARAQCESNASSQLASFISCSPHESLMVINTGESDSTS